MVAIDLGGGENARQQAQGAQGVGEHGEDQRLESVFAVVNVAERRVVGAQQYRLRFAQRAAGQDARVFQRDGVALLRHDAGGLHEGVGKSQETEFASGPQQQVLHKFAEIDHGHGDGGGRLGEVVDGGDGAVGVFGQALEAQKARGHVAVDGEAGGRDGAGAQRAQVDT